MRNQRGRLGDTRDTATVNRVQRARGTVAHYKKLALKRTRLGRKRLFIVRHQNGRVWKGPYKHGWTRKPKEYYLFGSEDFAYRALAVTGEKGTVQRVF